jgi:PEGA domain
MKKLMILFAAAAMAIAPMTASAARVIVGGPVIVGGYYGPAWGPYGGPVYPAFAYAGTGEVKLDTKNRDAEVFVNGAFAGTTKDARSLHLRPGRYSIEVRHAGQEALNQQVFVVAGKTLHLRPAL